MAHGDAAKSVEDAFVCNDAVCTGEQFARLVEFAGHGILLCNNRRFIAFD